MKSTLKSKKGFLLILLIIALVAMIVLLFWLPKNRHSSSKIKVTAGSFPLYLIALNLFDSIDSIDLDYIASAQSGCAHDYTLTTQDRFKLEAANTIIINGEGLDSYIEKALPKNQTKLINSSAKIDTFILLESHHHHHDGHDEACEEETHSTDEMKEVNPHFFVSPRLNYLMAQEITSQIIKKYPFTKKQISANLIQYKKQINSIQESLDSLKKKLKQMKVITQHSAFAYLAQDLDISIIALINEDDSLVPSTARILLLKQMIKQQNVSVIFNEPGYSDEVPKMLAAETKIMVRELNPVTSGPQFAPKNYYFTQMQKNIEVLKSLQ